MHLIALVASAGHVCCRYRLVAYRPVLEQAGHRLDLRSFPDRPWRWPQLQRDLCDADVVIVQRKLLQAWQLYFVRRSARVLVFDFDDAVYLRDSYAVRGLHSRARLRRFVTLLRIVDGAVAGNDFLFAQATRWVSPDRVHTIPTCVDPARYFLADHQRAGNGVELVWVGSASTLQGLVLAEPLLEQASRACPGLHLKVVCDRTLHLRRLPVLPCPWSEDGERSALAAADIGISWVPDDDWSRGKCGLKVLQYMAAGLPVVANPVGVHAAIVRHGETGFLAETPAQWVEAMSCLVHDPELRRRMGRAGRQRVADAYSVTVGAGRWVALLNALRRGRDAA
jgi:glycosyltransferase involved in cell wall biosynthesis